MEIQDQSAQRHDQSRIRVSIYDIYSRAKKKNILFCCSMIAFLTPWCDTVFLPVLTDVKTTLDATSSEVATTVSAYLGAVAIGLLIWGPLSDYYGRHIVLLCGLLAFEAVTIGCMFAPDINSLIVLRVAEGFIVGLTEAII